MRPEKKAVEVELSAEEKGIIEILKANENAMPLNLLKVKADLSGKKWDAAMKSLSKHALVKVAVNGEDKIVEHIG
jgi:lysyl-tRNA synthetase class 2